MKNKLSPTEIKPISKKRNRCHNCKFAGDQFKIVGKTHLHCEHPRYKQEDFESGKLSAWDTLREFWETCGDWQELIKPQKPTVK